MKFNFDTLKQQWTTRKSSAAAPGDSAPFKKVTVVDETPATTVAGIKLVSLDPKQIVLKPESDVKLVSLQALAKKQEGAQQEITMAAESSPEAETESSVVVPSWESGDTSLLESSPVFKNLSAASDQQTASLKKEYTTYRRKKIKKYTQMASVPVAAVFMIAVLFNVISPSQQLRVSVNPPVVSQDNQNISTGSGTWLSGKQLWQSIQQTGLIANLPDWEQVFQNQENLSIQEALKLVMRAAGIPILLPRDPKQPRDQYVVYQAVKQGIVLDAKDVTKQFSSLQLNKVLDFLKRFSPALSASY